jgi:hypothetical protein
LPDAVDPPDVEDLKAEYTKALGNGRVRRATSGVVISDNLGSHVSSGRAYGGKRPEGS